MNENVWSSAEYQWVLRTLEAFVIAARIDIWTEHSDKGACRRSMTEKNQ